jgi:hypothetical protein
LERGDQIRQPRDLDAQTLSHRAARVDMTDGREMI